MSDLTDSTWSFIDNLTNAASKVWSLQTQRDIAKANIDQVRLSNANPSSNTPNMPADVDQLIASNRTPLRLAMASPQASPPSNNNNMLIVGGLGVVILLLVLKK